MAESQANSQAPQYLPFEDGVAQIDRQIEQLLSQDSLQGIHAGRIRELQVQQTELLNLILGNKQRGHEYAIQLTTDNPHFGGLSGCTFTEAQSWGKIAKGAKMTQCFCDVTIGLPLLAQGLCEVEQLAKKRRPPRFDWMKWPNRLS